MSHKSRHFRVRARVRIEWCDCDVQLLSVPYSAWFVRSHLVTKTTFCHLRFGSCSGYFSQAFVLRLREIGFLFITAVHITSAKHGLRYVETVVGFRTPYVQTDKETKVHAYEHIAVQLSAEQLPFGIRFATLRWRSRTENNCR